MLAGCGPNVTATDATSGSGSGSAEGSSETAPGASTGPFDANTSSGAVGGTSSSSGARAETSSAGVPPEEVTVEGIWRWTDGFKTPIDFQTCDGEWLLVGFPLNGEIRAGSSRCSSTYMRFRGVRGLVPGHLGSYDGIIVDEVLEERFCIPGDCGAEDCEERICRVQCNIFDQGCGVGDRCVPYSPYEDTASATACVPTPARPVPLGGACHKRVDGVVEDDCGLGATCLGGGVEREGICVELCQGSKPEPTCDAGVCAYAPGVPGYCLPSCEPGLPGCDGECLSIALGPGHVCVPEIGIPELLAPCDEKGCNGIFVCSLEGPTEGRCIPPA